MKTIFIALFSLITCKCFSHSVVSYEGTYNHITVKKTVDWSEYEISPKFYILSQLADQLFQEKNIQPTDIFINFRHSNSKSDSSYLRLGYGTFETHNQRTGKSSSTSGLKLEVKDRDVDIPKLLKLIHAGLSNFDYVSSAQRRVESMTTIYNSQGQNVPDSIMSIPEKLIYTYLALNDSLVDKLVRKKTTRHLLYSENQEISYYYQNNQFHFYRVQSANRTWSEKEGTYILDSTTGEDILVVDKIQETFGGSNDGYFIFINDSVFHFIPRGHGKVQGPYTIDSLHSSRPPILNYSHYEYPVDRYTIVMNDYTNQKIAFFPDSNLIIKNFDKLENAFINDLLKKPKIEKYNDHSNDFIAAIAGILGISLLLNILQFWRHKKY